MTNLCSAAAEDSLEPAFPFSSAATAEKVHDPIAETNATRSSFRESVILSLFDSEVGEGMQRTSMYTDATEPTTFSAS
jgi:hypothetical protein